MDIIEIEATHDFSDRSLLYLTIKQKQTPRFARDDNSRFVSIFRKAQ